MRVVCDDCYYRRYIDVKCKRCGGWGTVEVVSLYDPRVEAYLRERIGKEND